MEQSYRWQKFPGLRQQYGCPAANARANKKGWFRLSEDFETCSHRWSSAAHVHAGQAASSTKHPKPPSTSTAARPQREMQVRQLVRHPFFWSRNKFIGRLHWPLRPTQMDPASTVPSDTVPFNTKTCRMVAALSSLSFAANYRNGQVR